jgi:Flp pilus assembly protein TadG
MAALARRYQRRSSSETGNALLEMAFVLPVLLLLIAAIMDFGFLFLQYEVVTNAAREGSRVGVLPDYQTADIEQRVRDYLTAGGLADAAATGVAYNTVALPGSGLNVNVVTVTVQYPGQFMFLGPISTLIRGGPYGNVTLRASSSMRVEQ